MTTPWTPGKVPPPPTRGRSNAIDKGDGGFKAAVGSIEAARRDALQRVLGGTRLAPAPSRVAKLAKSLASGAKGLKSAAETTKSAGSQGQAAIGMLSKFRPTIQADIMKLFGDALLSDVIDFIGRDVVDGVTNVLAEATPILGIAKSGLTVVGGIFKIATDTVSMREIGASKVAFSPGDAQAAVAALEGLIEREIAFNAVALARDTLALGAKAASAAGDLGTAGTMAIGITNGVISLIEKLAAAAIDFREMRAGNRLLSGTLSTELFVACPLTACYFITCASTSDILNLAPSKIGSASFQAEAEALRKRILAAQKRAAKAIETSRYMLEKDGVEVKPHMTASGGLSSFDHSLIQFKRKAHHFAQSVKASLPGGG